MKRIFLTLIALLIAAQTFSQVIYSVLPLKKQIFARNLSTNEGTVITSGTVNSSGTPYDQIQVKKYRDGIYQTTYSTTLSYSGNIANFSLNIPITAELSNYKIEVYGSTNSVLTLVTTVDSLAAGDAFIIQGQSNAAAGAVSGYGNTENQNSFIRVYGSGAISGYATAWNKANGDMWDGGGEGNAGQWGLRMTKDILDAYQIPIAIYNGANSGQPISWFIRNESNKFDQSTNYGRLLQRITETGFTNNIRAIFWYQGESNSFGTTTTSYKTSFNDLNSDWNLDYLGFEHLYIIQIKHGCGASKPNINKIQEAHRELADEIGNASIYASNGTTHASDKCHYKYSDGYLLTGDRLYALVNRDIYGAPDAANIESPAVVSAAQTALNQITLYLKNAADAYTWEVGVEKDFKLEGSSLKVSTGVFSGSSLVLTMSANLGTYTGISFRGHAGSGTPCIRNANGLGIVGFRDFPVTPFSPKFSALEMKESFSVYPNPANDFATIQFQLSEATAVTISVFDIAGRKVLVENLGLKQEGVQTYSLDASKFSKGIFEIIILEGSKVLHQKLVMQ